MATPGDRLSEIDMPGLPGAANFNQVSHPPGASLGPRWQDSVQFVVVYEGEARVWIDDRPPLLIGAGCIALLRPGHRESFRFATHQQTHHSFTHLRYPEVPARDLQSALSPLPDVLPLGRRLNGLMEVGLDTAAHPQPGDELLIPRLAHTLLCAYAAAAVHQQDQERGPIEPPPVRRARRFIEQRYPEPITLDDLAHAASVTANHLSRLFRRHLKTTPMRYLWRTRVEHGVALLRDSGLTIGEIADRVGFQNAFHFSRLVRQHYNQSPRALRQRFWDRAEHIG